MTRWGRTARWRTPCRSPIRPRWSGGGSSPSFIDCRSSCSCPRSCSRPPVRVHRGRRPRQVTGQEYCDDVHRRAGRRHVASDVDDRVYFGDGTGGAGTPLYWGLNFVLLVLLQAFTGWTPGKLITGIRVVREDGATGLREGAACAGCSGSSTASRTSSPASSASSSALSTPGHRRVGDMAAKTFVVEAGRGRLPDRRARACEPRRPRPVAPPRPCAAPAPRRPEPTPGWASPRQPPSAPATPSRRHPGHREGPSGTRRVAPTSSGIRPRGVDAVGRGLQGLDPHPGPVARSGAAPVGGDRRARSCSRSACWRSAGRSAERRRPRG